MSACNATGHYWSAKMIVDCGDQLLGQNGFWGQSLVREKSSQIVTGGFARTIGKLENGGYALCMVVMESNSTISTASSSQQGSINLEIIFEKKRNDSNISRRLYVPISRTHSVTYTQKETRGTWYMARKTWGPLNLDKILPRRYIYTLLCQNLVLAVFFFCPFVWAEKLDTANVYAFSM